MLILLGRAATHSIGRGMGPYCDEIAEVPMSLVLQIVLGLSIATLTVFIVLLLLQARRTAASVQRLAESAAQDLHRVAEDVHEVRQRVDEVAQIAKNTFEVPSMVSQVVTGILGGIPALLGRQNSTQGLLQTLLTGAQTALHLFRRRKMAPPKEESHE